MVYLFKDLYGRLRLQWVAVQCDRKGIYDVVKKICQKADRPRCNNYLI